MTPKVKISQASVAEMHPTEERYIVWDVELPGFGVRVMPSGVKTYILKYRSPVNGKQCRPGIGRTSVVKAEAARKIASEWLGNLRLGIDPQLEKSNRIEQQRSEDNALTFEGLCELYIEQHAIPYKRPRTAKEDEAKINRYVLPAIGDKKAKSVIRADVTELFTKISQKAPVQANRVVALIRNIFNFAIENQVPGISENPATHVKFNQEDPRDVYLKPDEINHVISEIMKVESDTTRDYMLLCICTGCRMDEAASAEWEHFDLDEGIWRKPSSHTKQKRVHRLVLNPAAIRILEGRVQSSRFVFPGTGASGHIDAKGHKKQWARIRVAIGRPEVRFYDAARHSFASLLQSKGADLYMIGRLLGHTQLRTTQRYVHLYDDDVRDATNKAAELIDLEQHRKAKA